TDLLLLLDADIAPAPGLVQTLKEKLMNEDLHLLSLMAQLRMKSFWELVLIPAFIYFFKLLYPFHLSNQGHPWIAAAAGGCILVRSDSLAACGGFSVIRDALIDDCALARVFRNEHYKTWIGLTHSATSLREYTTLASIWQMVTRTAFTQLHHSWLLLLLCTGLLAVAFSVPSLLLVMANGTSLFIAVTTIGIMLASYLPVLRYYGIPAYWALLLPLAGTLYLLMTCHSALLHALGRGAHWKGRDYGRAHLQSRATKPEETSLNIRDRD
ncbi:MAG: glycosyl transferase, partial [Proteobacteria bacterium]|nr:glycosyl transferase [Pseudomonadota bacterium]